LTGFVLVLVSPSNGFHQLSAWADVLSKNPKATAPIADIRTIPLQVVRKTSAFRLDWDGSQRSRLPHGGGEVSQNADFRSRPIAGRN
jgi:hypothetical protein